MKPVVEGKRNISDSKEVVDINKVNQSTLFLANIYVNSVVSKNTWHRRLGHPSSRIFYLITRRCNMTFKNEKLQFCQSCQMGKSHSLPFSLFESRATKPFDLIHTDVWGPTPVMSMDGFHCYVLLLDDFSRYV